MDFNWCHGCCQEFDQCVCEQVTPESYAALLGMWPGDPSKPVKPLSNNDIKALADKGIMSEPLVVKSDGSIEHEEETVN